MEQAIQALLHQADLLKKAAVPLGIQVQISAE